jgi:hypothetical protein
MYLKIYVLVLVLFILFVYDHGGHTIEVFLIQYTDKKTCPVAFIIIILFIGFGWKYVIVLHSDSFINLFSVIYS